MSVYPVFATRGVTKNATPVSGVTHAGYLPKPMTRQDPGGAGSKGVVGEVLHGWDVSVSIYGNNIPVLLALLGTAKESVILKYTTTAGALRKVTILKVEIVEVLGQADIPRGDDGAPIAKIGVRGYVAWAVNDTLATVIVDAADA